MATPAVAMDPALTGALADAVRGRGLAARASSPAAPATTRSRSRRLTGVAMLFVRCAGGISHHPAESVAAADAQVALEVLVDAVLALA